MIHARSDYNRIQDPAVRDPSLLSAGSTPIGEDEPVFLIRARDVCGPPTLRHWAARVRDSGGDERTVQRVLAFATRMEDWQVTHGCKVPDAPEDTLV